jgi:hypothetical protein
MSVIKTALTAAALATLRFRAGWQARMVSARKIACDEPDPR